MKTCRLGIIPSLAKRFRQQNTKEEYSNSFNGWQTKDVSSQTLVHYVYKVKIKDSELCDFCHGKMDTLWHLLCSSKTTQNFWIAVEKWVTKKTFLVNENYRQTGRLKT